MRKDVEKEEGRKEGRRTKEGRKEGSCLYAYPYPSIQHLTRNAPLTYPFASYLLFYTLFNFFYFLLYATSFYFSNSPQVYSDSNSRSKKRGLATMLNYPVGAVARAQRELCWNDWIYYPSSKGRRLGPRRVRMDIFVLCLSC